MSGEAASYQGGGSNYNESNNNEHHSFLNSIQSVIGNTENMKPAEDHEIQAAKDSYEQIYQKQDQNHSPEAVGNAAAVRALEDTQKSGGGMNDMIKLAINYAMKFFAGGSNGAAGANSSGQNQAMQQAAMMAMKLFMSQQASGHGNQQGGSGGVGNLLNMFMGSANNTNNQQQQQASSKLDIGSIVGSVSSILGNSGQQQAQAQAQPQQQQQQQSGSSGFSSVAAGLMSKILK